MNSKFKVNSEAVKSCLEYIQRSSDYTFEKYLKEYNRWDNVDRSGRNTIIHCPFHKDKTPSLSIDEDSKIFRCFSCERGGNLVKFISYFNEIVLGSRSGFYFVLNNILSKDDKMKLMTQYSSIFIEEKRTLSEISNFKRKKFSPNKDKNIFGYLELYNVMKREDLLDIETIKLAISYVQEGRDPNDIYRILKNQDVSLNDTVKIGLSIDDILNIDFNLEDRV